MTIESFSAFPVNNPHNAFAFRKAVSTNASLSYKVDDTNCQRGACSQNWLCSEHSLGSLPQESNQSLVMIAQGVSFSSLCTLFSIICDAGANVFISLNRFDNISLSTVLNLRILNSAPITKQVLVDVSDKLNIDICLKPDATIDQKGLVVFDMDSTVIEMECIDEIAKLAGVGDEVAQVTERAMQGEIAFGDSLIHRVACLEGVDVTKLASIRARLPFSPGFEVLVTTLKQHEWKIAIASGGFTYFADHIKQLFDLDYALSNQLGMSEGLLTGKVDSDIIDAQAKADLLERLASQYQIDKQQTIAVGDGANDLVMMQSAGFGLAYHAKPAVRKEADASVSINGLESLLYLLG